MTPSRHGIVRETRGFTLIEALVALLVLSIGLLGIASLQLTSLRFNQSASTRSQATLLAYDIIDRMRVNPQVAANGGYDVDFAKSKTGAALADKDVQQWKGKLSTSLPAGDGRIVRVVGATTTTYRVTIQWDDSRGQNQKTEFRMETQL